MANKTTRPKMDRSERAKQFMPFDAVKGLREALEEKERETAQKSVYEKLQQEMQDNMGDKI